MRAKEFVLESTEFDKQLTVYKPAEKEPWSKDPAMAKARELNQRYIDPEGRIWSFDQNKMGWGNYQGLRKAKNIPGVNLNPVGNMVGKQVFHCTNKLSQIQKTGGLKPRVDRTGENEYGRTSTHWDPFIPVIGIWITTKEQAKWAGKNCVSFTIEPTDKVFKAYGEGLVVLNPIPLDRLTIE